MKIERPSSGSGDVRRTTELLSLAVLDRAGRNVGFVGDLRVGPSDRVVGVNAELVLDGIVVDGRHAGSMLGYDRHSDQGPWVLRQIVRLIHRHAFYLPWDAVLAIEWADDIVRIDESRRRPLESATRSQQPPSGRRRSLERRSARRFFIAELFGDEGKD
jgi:hypothetical protein